MLIFNTLFPLYKFLAGNYNLGDFSNKISIIFLCPLRVQKVVIYVVLLVTIELHFISHGFVFEF